MYKFSVVFVVFICLLTACTQDEVVPKEQEIEDEQIVVTPDGKVTFEIINNIKVPQEKVEEIKDELLTAYEVIQNSIQTAYVPSDKINVYLNEGDLASLGLASRIELYGVKEDRYPLIHELTHSLLGYGKDFDTSSGYFTQEGFASYLEEKYGENKTYPHKLVKYFMDANKLIPISNLIDSNLDESYFRPVLITEKDVTLRLMSYTHASSFVTYLVETYGLEKFEQIYNEKDLSKKVAEVYGKNISELENEWIVFLNKDSNTLTYEEKMDMGYFFAISSVIDTIDSKFFSKE